MYGVRGEGDLTWAWGGGGGVWGKGDRTVLALFLEVVRTSFLEELFLLFLEEGRPSFLEEVLTLFLEEATPPPLPPPPPQLCYEGYNNNNNNAIRMKTCSRFNCKSNTVTAMYYATC